MTTNTQIAGIFNNIGNMLEILGENPFKIRAYKNASKTVRVLDEDINEIAQKDQLTDIKGIGKELAKKIREYAETGKIEYYEELKLRVPEELLKIKNIQGIGPKLLQTLFNDFNVRNISDLENTISEPEFINSRGVGNKIINEIKVGIKLFKSHINKINLGFALPTAEYFKKELTDIPYVNMVEIVGDLRRGKETVETIDLVICSEEIKKTADKISKFPIINKDKFIIFVHALRNSLIPVTAGIGHALGLLFAGSFLIEKTCNIPGMGLLGFDAILQRDFPIILGTLVFLVIIRLTGNILSDLVWAFIDPRIRFH